MNEELDLLRRAVEEPVGQMILAEVISPAHSNEVAHQIRAWADPTRPLAEFGFNTNRDDANALWEHCRDAVAHWDADNPGLLLVRDDSPSSVRIAHEATDKPTSIGFWRTMNQLREKWDALPSQTIFLVTHEQYFFLTTEADHFKRWIPLKLHLPSPAEEPTPRTLSATLSRASDESLTAALLLDDLEDQEAARQNWDAYQERLREAGKRGESPQTLARRYYLPLMAAAITLHKWEEAANYNERISRVRLPQSQQLRWLRLRSRLEEAQGDIAQAVATAEERLELSKELDKEQAKEGRKQQKYAPSRSTLSALLDLYLLHDRQKNLDEAEYWLLQGLKVAPNDKVLLGNYALFLKNVRQDYDKAEQFYLRALETDPNDVTIVGGYANFLKDVRQDYDKAEQFYLRALEADPKRANILSSYANFLRDVRQDYDKAEQFHLRALETDPKNATILSSYALFLCLARHDFPQAGNFFRRAMEAAPDNPQYPINYAALLLSQGQKDDGRVMLERAATVPNLSDAQQVAVAFHRYIHFPEEVPSPLKTLKQAIKSGKRAPGWTFELNIERAQQDKHPNLALLKALAAVITENKSVTTLDTFREWRSV